MSEERVGTVEAEKTVARGLDQGKIREVQGGNRQNK